MAFQELDDFEQEEQVKKWIKDNWLNMVVGIGLGLAGVYGINWWKQHQLQQKYATAEQFQQFSQVIGLDELEEAEKLAESLAAANPSGFYAFEARLVLASHYLDKGQLDKAIGEYEKIIAAKPAKALAELARLRLARLQLANNAPDAALESLKMVLSDPMQSEKEEISGDVALVNQQPEQAHEHYQNASNAGEGYSGGPLLEMKLANTGG